MNPVLLAALIEQIAIPELVRWLRERQQANQPITDADIIAKLGVDADEGIRRGQAWLDAHRQS